MNPIYTTDNCTVAYQLNWSLAVFAKHPLPGVDHWIDRLKAATEPDGVRVLDATINQPNVAMFFLSSKPGVCPSEIVRSIKGRWLHLLRTQLQQPAELRRNYRITSVGEANCGVLDQYVNRQTSRHRMAEPRVQETLEHLQFDNPAIDLGEVRTGNYGQFVQSLQVVVENSGGWNEIRPEVLSASRDMIVKASAAKGWRLKRVGLLANHMHVLVGAGMTESPSDVALSLMNNLAYVQEMRPVFRFSFYVGTFGGYDRGAIRQRL